jgi:hypothetical protein
MQTVDVLCYVDTTAAHAENVTAKAIKQGTQHAHNTQHTLQPMKAAGAIRRHCNTVSHKSNTKNCTVSNAVSAQTCLHHGAAGAHDAQPGQRSGQE